MELIVVVVLVGCLLSTTYQGNCSAIHENRLITSVISRYNTDVRPALDVKASLNVTLDTTFNNIIDVENNGKKCEGGALFRRAIADRKGIKNLGSTCYLSATLQMLVRDPVTDSIIEHSRNESSKSPASTDSDCLIVESVFQTQLAKDVVDTLRQLRSPCVTERHIESVDPKNVLMFLSKIDSEFTMGEQQDAQECLTLLLNELFAKLPETALSFIGYLSVYQTCLDCAVQKDKIVDRYSTLILPLPNTSECRLEECMDQYFEDEILDDENKVQCETCSRNTATGKTTKLLTTPESLYLILGRSKLNQKNCAVVSLPRYINMANRVVEVLPEHEHRHEYSLEAAVLHRGPTTNSGHYTVLIRQGSKWLHFDDDNNVRTKKEEYFETKGVQTDVYILRYKKKEYEEYLYLEETDANFSCVEDKKFWSPSTKGDEESRRPSTHPVIENTVDVCDESDLETLKNGQWLNERVVNAYLKLIEREAKKSNNSRIKIIESYILQKWHSNRNAVIAEIWTRQHKRFLLFDEDIVSFPVNETNHWTLMLLCYVHVANYNAPLNISEWFALNPNETIPLTEELRRLWSVSLQVCRIHCTGKKDRLRPKRHAVLQKDDQQSSSRWASLEVRDAWMSTTQKLLLLRAVEK